MKKTALLLSLVCVMCAAVSCGAVSTEKSANSSEITDIISCLNNTDSPEAGTPEGYRKPCGNFEMRDDNGNVRLTVNDLYEAEAVVQRYVSSDGREELSPVVVLTFTEEGKAKFSDTTGELIGQPLHIYVDGELVTSPVINERIDIGTAEISGLESSESAQDIARKINGFDS